MTEIVSNDGMSYGIFMVNLCIFHWESHWDQKLELSESPKLEFQVGINV